MPARDQEGDVTGRLPLPLLTAYGDALAPLRVPVAQVEERLRTEDGLIKFLKPGWVGGAKVVMTTYETLRDYEFSFAAQRWCVMVCDEAQRIKNPAAMVTRAAKKQNAAFKIACTGTPVENTLADIWCLFDFVQPGLLGALNDFGIRYRKPIEARTDAERSRVDELRKRIAPQILRRMKAEVAENLPRKVVNQECRNLQLSDVQRGFYANAIDSFRGRNDASVYAPFKNALGLLHYLRLVCTDPRQHGLSVFRAEAEATYRRKAPKLDWLLKQLQVIKDRGDGEKAIVFCEFREIQRLLAHYIEGAFAYKPDIINGDTNASSQQSDSRQKRIRKFQQAPGFGVLILSPMAVGFGVNIQAANHVVHYTRTWNPAKEDQATDRAYRIGQTKDVHVYCPVVAASDFTTFDVKLDQLLTHKRQLAEDMLNGAGDVDASAFLTGTVGPGSFGHVSETPVDLEMALRMDGRHFEALVYVLYDRQGYRCLLTPSSNDKGVDVVAIQYEEKRGLLVQAKASSRDGRALNWDAIKDVVTGAPHYQKQHPDVDFLKVCFTNQHFNEGAHRSARENGVKMVEQEELKRLLDLHSVTMSDLSQVLNSS